LPDGLSRYRRFAEEIVADGIDVDVSTWIGRRRYRIPSVLEPDQGLSVMAVWLTPVDLAALLKRVERNVGAEGSVPGSGIELVVLLGDGSEAANDQTTVMLAHQAVKLIPWVRRATLAVPATAPEGGRLHLIRLQVLRRFCEEWALDLAFDLCRRSDALWEAEAAMQIAGRRLTAIRVASSLVNRSARHVEVHRRAIRAAADLGFRGTISLVPQTPWWLGWHEASVRTELASNRDVVVGLFGKRFVPSNQPNPLSLH
jgi:hypothetical protein